MRKVRNMTYDGSLKFDTKIDSSGFDKGISLLKKAAAGLGLAKLTNEIIDVGATFEASMSQVAAISMATEEEFEALSAAAKEMGATTKYTAAEAADGLQYLSLAGYSAAESIEALPKVLRLAQAGGMDLAYASDLLTDSMAVMGLGIKDMDNFSDQLAMAASKSNTSVAQLGEAVLVAGGQAKLASMSTEEMNTALGILADNGIKGSEGGTALRNTLKNLYTPTSQSAKVMKKLGLSTSDAQGNLRDAQDVLKDLKKSLDGMSESKRIETMGDIFDTRTIAAASALLENCGDRWDELEGYLSDCDGAAKRMADTMNDNLRGRLDEMSSAAEALGITVFEKAAPGLKTLAEAATSAISAVDLFAQNGGLDIISNVAPILLAGAAGYMTYTGAIKLAATAQAAFNAVSMANPIGLAIAGATMLTVATVKLTKAAIEPQVTAELERTQAIRDNIRAMKDSSLESNAQAKAALAETDRIKGLADELRELVDTNGKVQDSDKDRVNYILGELNNALGTEYKLVDDNVQKWNELEGSVDKVIQKQQAQALLDSVSGEYQEANANKKTYADEVASASARITEIETRIAQLKDIDRQIQESYDNYEKHQELLSSVGLKRRHQLTREISELESELIRVTERHDAASAQWNLNNETIMRYEALKTASLSGNYEELEKAIADFSQTIITANSLANASDYERENVLKTQLAEQITLYNGVCSEMAAGTEGFTESLVNDYADAVAKSVGEFVKGGGDLSSAVAIFNEKGLVLSDELINAMAAEIGVGTETIRQAITDTITNAETEAKIKATEAGTSIGGNLSAGIVVGMQQGAWQVNSAGASLVQAALTGATNKAVIRSPSHVFRDQVGYMMSLGVAYGVEDGIPVAAQAMERLCDGLITEAKDSQERQEKLQQRVLQSLKNSFDLGLITEEQYYSQLTKLRDSYFAAGAEKWEKYTLEILKHNIDATEKQRDALAKIYDDIANNITDKIDEIGDAQASLADGMRSMTNGVSTITYKGLGADGGDIVDTVLDVNSLREANNTKEAFQNAALAAKDRIAAALGEENKELTAQIYDTIRTMGADEGLAFANAILDANNNTFSEWIAEQIRGAGLNDEVARSLYAEDMENMGEQLAEEMYSAWDAELAKQFGQLPADFWELGGEAAAGFYDGFMSDIEGYIADIEEQISMRISGYSADGGFGGTNINGSYNTTSYTIQTPGGSEGSWIRAIKDRETIEKMTGGY